MNKRVAEIAAKLADQILAQDCMKVEGETLLQHEARRNTILVEVGEYLQPILYPEFCPGCGDKLCPECGEHMLPPAFPHKVEEELWDLCEECMIYSKPDGSVAVPPTVGSQDLRVITLQSRKRHYLN